MPLGESPIFSSHWKGTYVILHSLNDLTYCIQEVATQKEIVVHFDRPKLFFEPLSTSKVPTRDWGNAKKLRTYHHPSNVQQQEQVAPDNDHGQCTWHYPYHTVPSGTTCSHGVACTTPFTTSTSVTTPVGSLKSVPTSPSSFHSRATASHSHGSPCTPKTTTSFRSTTPIPKPPTSFVKSPTQSRNLPSSLSTTSSVRTKPWLREVFDNATGTLRFGAAPVASPAAPQLNFRSSSKQQRNAQPLWKARLPLDLSELSSSANAKK